MSNSGYIDALLYERDALHEAAHKHHSDMSAVIAERDAAKAELHAAQQALLAEAVRNSMEVERAFRVGYAAGASAVIALPDRAWADYQREQTNRSRPSTTQPQETA